MAITTAIGVQPDLEKTVSKRSHSNVPPAELLANEADTELLGNFIQLSKMTMSRANKKSSQVRIQARASPQLYHA
jgi:hypothetical protein